MIKYFLDVAAVFLLFGFFGYMHSYLATHRVKNFLIKKFGSLIAFYRLTYVLFSLISFGVIYKIAPNMDLNIYDLPYPFDFIILIPEFLGLAGLLWTLKYFSTKEFLGINQIFRWYHDQYRIDELDEKLSLRIEGPYKYCRHPVYFFSIVFLVFRPEMNLSYATFLVCIIAYFYIGSFYEEFKMVAMFGQIYIDYQNKVPRIVPVYLYWNKHFNSLKNVKSNQII
ncbi:MAG: methyltransferase family protein [Ignavibacteriaceae bacterium]